MYIISEDIYRTYPKTSLDALTGNDEKKWKDQVLSAVEEVASYLRARYDVDLIFVDIPTHVSADEYILGALVENSVDGLIYEAILAVPADTLISNETYWIQNDPRNQKIVSLTVDVLLYYLLGRLNNNDIPQFRRVRYDGDDPKQMGGAVGYLKSVAKGIVQPDLPLLETGQTDQTGNVVMYTSASASAAKNTSF